MKISTQTSLVFARLGEDAGLELFKKSGYDLLDCSFFCMSSDRNCVWFQDDWREHAKELRKKCEDLGMAFDQGHAPFSYDMKKEEIYNERFLKDVPLSIEIAGILGIKNLIVHPLHYDLYYEREEYWHDRNMEYYRSLIPYAQDAGVNISLENMWQYDKQRGYIVDDVCSRPEEFVSYVDELNSYAPCFNACLDLGHTVLVRQNTANFIRALGHDRLKALHIHDNDLKHDSHTLIGCGAMDYNPIMQALHDIDYDGVFTYEADNFPKGFGEDQLLKSETFMVDVARYWIAKYDALD